MSATDPEATDQANLAHAPTAPDVRLEALTVHAGERCLLENVDLDIYGGKITVLVGGSGAGKSVLLRTLSGLNDANDGSIRWSGQIRLDGRSGDELSGVKTLRRRVGIVFQQFALFDELTPTANVQFAIDHRLSDREDEVRPAPTWLEELGVPSGTRVANLSGGQKQRLAIARTLAASPDVILYDEPTSGLDAASGKRVAALIRKTHDAHHRTSIVVTHDYETLIPIADDVLLLDSNQRTLRRVPKGEWPLIAERMEAVALPDSSEEKRQPPTLVQQALAAVDQSLVVTGTALVAACRLVWDALPVFPRQRWGWRFTAHYLRLVGGPSACVYLILAGLIIGFTTTYFTFRFLPFRTYTQPLLIDELLASIGFALYRILVPVLATILIAARCGAAVAADVGVKKYGGQVDALRTLGVDPRSYLLSPIILAFLIATPCLEWLAYSSARLISLVTFAATHPSLGTFFWHQHFYRNLVHDGSQLFDGWAWVLVKNLVCGVGTGAIGYYRGLREKHSASDVSHAITSTVLWTTLFVLVVHFVVALIEF